MKNLSMFFVLIVVSAGLIFSGTITVNQPNAQSEWKAGKSFMINWTATGCANTTYKINIYKDSIAVANFKMQLIATNTTSKSWKIPNGYEGKYIIRVKSDPAEQGCVGDSAKFTVLKSGITFGVLDNIEVLKKKKVTFKPKPGMFKPVIDGILPVPLGALQAGTHLFVKGEKFGTQKGQILILGNFPGGKIALENVKWESSGKANGFIPDSANGQPNQVVSVQIVTSYNAKSDPFGSPQFKGREEKVLTADAVGVSCGTDGNDNVCNGYSNCESEFTVGCDNQYAICGWHQNNWGAIGDDVGDDIYSINLKNGWVLKSMQKVDWKKSSGDEVLSGPTPSFPAGQSSWNAVVHWKVTPNDSVRYNIKIIVEGPIGTNYK